MGNSRLGLDEVVKLLTDKFGSLFEKVGTKNLNGLDADGVQIWQNIGSNGEEEFGNELD